MEEKPTRLFNSQINQVSLNSSPQVSSYFVPGEGNEETSLLDPHWWKLLSYS